MPSPPSAQPPWAVRLLADIDAADARAIALARGMSAAQLNWRPEPHVWSVGQCLQHLLQTNRVYVPPIARALEGEPRSPVNDVDPGWFGGWFLRTYIEPSPGGKRAKAPGKIAPAPDVDAAILDRFVESNDAIRDLIRRAAGCDVNRIRFANPFIPLLRFRVGTGLEIVCAHQRRHLLQAERMAKRASGAR